LFSPVDPYVIAVAFVFGLLFGSFVNVVIHRIPVMLQREWAAQAKEILAPHDESVAAGSESEGEGEADLEPYNLVVPRSKCPSCNTQIAAIENIPVLSYIALRGRCRHCQTPISIQYPLVEILCGLLVALAILAFGTTIQGALAALMLLALVALAGIDFHTQLLPDAITLPMLWLGLLANTWNSFAALDEAVLGAVAGYMILWLVYQAFKLLTGKEGMGYGDFKLLAMLGAWFGWQSLPAIILLSSMAGACIGVAMVLTRGHDRQIPIPFGPYLAIAGCVYLFAGEAINAWYLGLLAPR
jgi:leader peptidase (prepilin peptidase)/N-methyltransferase